MVNKSEDFKPVNSEEKFISKEIDILNKNKKFYSTNRTYIDEVLTIINGQSNISIRVLDYFVTNYSKKHNTCYKIKINGREEFFYVNNEYKNQLGGYSKRYFDPFCRQKKIIYSYKNNDDDKDINFLSSIGQLNFFRWAISNKVIKYVHLHIKEIEIDMKETAKITKDKKTSSINDSIAEDDMSDIIINDDPDPLICSSDKINSLRISPVKKNSSAKSDSESKRKRQQLSKSVYDHGIKKSNIPIKLDFD